MALTKGSKKVVSKKSFFELCQNEEMFSLGSPYLSEQIVVWMEQCESDELFYQKQLEILKFREERSEEMKIFKVL